MTGDVETSDQAAVRALLVGWAADTRAGRLDAVLQNHLSDALIYDVLAPMKYEGAAAYRASWGDWHPETEAGADGAFAWEDLEITSGVDVAFAHGFIRCGGAGPDGRVFSDLVRATFCLQRVDGALRVAHQHISKPIQLGAAA